MTTRSPMRRRGLSQRDRAELEKVREILGPEPAKIGFARGIFRGWLREDLLFPYPEQDEAERERCDRLLAEFDRYLREEHPAVRIDIEQQIPREVIDRLFELGILGMVVPREYGGGGYSFTSYCRVLERLGRTCQSTTVLVSAHESMGCYGMMRFGSPEQKERFLPRLARDTLCAFCLSEPNVGSDAGGQETTCELSPDGTHYVLRGEKKWATSGALAGLFTVMAKQKLRDPETGKERERVTALLVTPDMEGVDIFSRNRSKCGIRGTWQARIRFNDVVVPRENLLHEEGQGLRLALTCLDYGRGSLAAGILGAAKEARDQGLKWSRYRYQFDRPLAEFDQVKAKTAEMAALTETLDAVLYATAGMIDRGDDDIMLETAMCKVLASELGHRTVDLALQIMGGEGYMTESILERIWRDTRIHRIVEGASEVMHSFVFAYGAGPYGEALEAIKEHPFRHAGAALRVAAELFLGVRRGIPRLSRPSPQLADLSARLERSIRDFSHALVKTLYRRGEGVITEGLVHERLSRAALWIYALAATLAKADRDLRAAGGELDRRVIDHIFALGDHGIARALDELRANPDATFRAAGDAAGEHSETLPNADFAIPEATPVAEARGSGRKPDEESIPQFGEGRV